MSTAPCTSRGPRSPGGFTYVALLAAIVIIGITMTAAGKYWAAVAIREKEEELFFRGDQYRQAIESYYRARVPNAFPERIEQLLQDDRSPQAKRHLRQQFKDPVTGEDFEVVRDQTKGNRITGVFSKSEREPLKKRDFPAPYQEFEGKQSYTDWKFVYTPQLTAVTVPPQRGAPGQPGAVPAPPAPPALPK
jgi:type II secretory pathway pseudopilin PulG